MTDVRVEPSPSDVLKVNFDVGIGAVGYETRARYVASFVRQQTARIVGVTFPDRRVLAFDANRDWYATNASILDADDEGFGRQFRDALTMPRSEAPPAAWVDISSLS